MISGFSGQLRQRNTLTDLERARVPGFQPGFAYVWQPRTRSWTERRDLTAAEFDQESQSQRSAGSRLSDFEAYGTSAGTRYAGVWVANSEGIDWWSDYDMTATEYGNARQNLMSGGYRPVDLEGYATPGGIRWAAVWYRSCNNTDWHEIRGMDRTAYQQKVDSLAALGFRVVDFESYRTSGGQRYAAIWEKIPVSRAWAVRTDRDLKWFLNYHRQYEDEGLRLIDFEAYDTANGIRYAGVWAENDARYDMPFKAALDDSVRAYRAQHRIPGISVVVMRNGEVIYRRGFGWADSTNAKTANSGTIYLTASIAKIIGATIAARIEERTRIDLKRPTSDFLPNLPSHHTHTLEQLLAKIGCVRHYDTLYQDPLSQYYQGRDSALKQIWDDPLLSGCTPGRQYHYSTHGFTFVGGVLEKVLNKEIARIVTDELTRPFGLASMRTVAPLVSFGGIGGSWVPRYHLAQGYEYVAPFRSRSGISRPGRTGRTDTVDYEDSSWKVLGGGLQTNALDLARFGWLTLNASIVSTTTRDNRLWSSLTDTTTAWSAGTVRPSVGLAWVLSSVCTGTMNISLRCSIPTRRVAEHGGSALGARSQLQVYRDDGLVVAVLTNQRNTPVTCPASNIPGACAHPIRGLANQVARIVFRNPPP
jgi:CubicO group peptidase (beta-lactamase class C family)